MTTFLCTSPRSVSLLRILVFVIFLITPASVWLVIGFVVLSASTSNPPLVVYALTVIALLGLIGSFMLMFQFKIRLAKLFLFFVSLTLFPPFILSFLNPNSLINPVVLFLVIAPEITLLSQLCKRGGAPTENRILIACCRRR